MLLALVGGGGTDCHTTNCSLEASASVVVWIADAAGAPLAVATVSYRVDSGPILATEYCEAIDACATFIVEREVAGQFSIRADQAEFQSAFASVTVQRDVCHVITREFVMTLVRAA